MLVNVIDPLGRKHQVHPPVHPGADVVVVVVLQSQPVVVVVDPPDVVVVDVVQGVSYSKSLSQKVLVQSPGAEGQKDGGTHWHGEAVVVVVVPEAVVVVAASQGLNVVDVVVPTDVVVVDVVVVAALQVFSSISQVKPSTDTHLHLPAQFSGAAGSPVVVVAEPATTPRSTM